MGKLLQEVLSHPARKAFREGKTACERTAGEAWEFITPAWRYA
ncbi:hypothetical protein [Pigmentiphaga kullae]|nr:hypothetical protein [Pigmentiphaga kullae]